MSGWGSSITGAFTRAASATASFASSSYQYASSTRIGQAIGSVASGAAMLTGLYSVGRGAVEVGTNLMPGGTWSGVGQGMSKMFGGGTTMASLYTTGYTRAALTATSVAVDYYNHPKKYRAARHLVTGGTSLIQKMPSFVSMARSSLADSKKFDQYQQTYNNYIKTAHEDLSFAGQPGNTMQAIMQADRFNVRKNQGKTALQPTKNDFSYLDISEPNNSGNRTAVTHTMLMLESPAFERAGKKVSNLIKHQEMVIKRKEAVWDNKKNQVSSQVQYTVLGGTDAPKVFNKQQWKEYKGTHFDTSKGRKIGRVRITSGQANSMLDHHNDRRAKTLETDSGQPKLFGHSIRFLTEYTRGNVCQTHTRDTIDQTLGRQTTDKLTKTFGLSTQGLRRPNTHASTIKAPTVVVKKNK